MYLGTLILTKYRIFTNSPEVAKDFRETSLNKDLIVSFARKVSTGEYQFVTRYNGKQVIILTDIREEAVINSSKIGNFYMIFLQGEDINE